MKEMNQWVHHFTEIFFTIENKVNLIEVDGEGYGEEKHRSWYFRGQLWSYKE